MLELDLFMHSSARVRTRTHAVCRLLAYGHCSLSHDSCFSRVPFP